MKALPNWKTRWAGSAGDTARRGLDLYRVSCPIGVVLVIFESRPDVVVQISALAVKSGNAVILKGGREAVHSNRVLAEILRQTADDFEEMPINALSLVESRDEVSQLVQMSEELDLIIPRGSNELVQSIQARAQVPVLGHADGICHVFIDANADPKKRGRWFWIPKQIIPRSVMPWKPCWWIVNLAPNF